MGRVEATYAEQVRQREMAVTSFKRITSSGGKIHFPTELGDAYHRTPKEKRDADAEALLARVDERYKAQYSPEVYALGRDALKTFLTRFSVPRPTQGEAPMQLSMIEWANENGFHSEIDKVGNIAVVIPGRKNGKPTTDTQEVFILHHHLDKVAIAKEGAGINPNLEDLKPEVWDRNDDHADKQLWIRAKDGLTSLGADNGAGGAVLWQVAEEFAHSNADHPTVVVLATVGEEGDMDGAKGISFQENPQSLVAPLFFPNPEEKRRLVLVNNDMELDKPKPSIIIGSFGLETFKATQEVTTESVPANYDVVTVSVSELRGGHSGLYADRAHAGKILIEELVDILGKPSTDNIWKLCSFTAGEKHNEIAPVGHATLALPHGKVEALKKALRQRLEEEQVRLNEPKLQFAVEVPTERPSVMLDQQSTQNAIALLSGLAKQHGIHVDAEGRKETFTYQPTHEELYTRALNIGVVRVGPEGVTVDMSARIGIAKDPHTDEAFNMYANDLAPLESIGGDTHVGKGITVPTWKLAENSPLPNIAGAAFDIATKDLPTVEGDNDLAKSVVTAGLEVSVFKDLLAQAQSLVFGMYITDIHKAGEALQIPSFFQNALLVKTFLEMIAAHPELLETASS